MDLYPSITVQPEPKARTTTKITQTQVVFLASQLIIRFPFCSFYGAYLKWLPQFVSALD